MKMGSKVNKTTRTNANRKIVNAIQKHLTGTVTLEGVKYTPASLAKMFQKGIGIADATDAAKTQWHAAVATEKQNTQELSGVQSALRSHVAALYGETSTEYADFGFAPKKVAKVDVATKAKAAQERAATRKARNTMGKRQKQEVTGETPAAPEPTTPSATAAPAPTPAASIATPSNGAPVAPHS